MCLICLALGLLTVSEAVMRLLLSRFLVFGRLLQGWGSKTNRVLSQMQKDQNKEETLGCDGRLPALGFNSA